MHTITAQPVANKRRTLFDAEEIPHRIRNIAMMRGLGYSFREIAEQLDITPQAVSLMLTRHQRSLRSLKGAIELRQLSARAVNALGRHRIATREEARNNNILELLRGERNCGRKTLEEIERWMSESEQRPVTCFNQVAC